MKRPFKAIEEEEEVGLMSIMSPDLKQDDPEDEDDDELSLLHGQSSLGEKKRRLSVNQVKALEQNFEVENKLDPERKVRLAQDLGLQPRQVAVWFQNRRARWKTKQLERDYGALKGRYDALKVDCDSLRRDKEVLVSEIKELKAKLESNTSVSSLLMGSTTVEEEKPAMMYRDGASDSDSSVVFNDETSPYSGVVMDQQCNLVDYRAHCTSFLFDGLGKGQDEREYLDEGLLSGEELCSWYCSVQEWDRV